MRSFILMLALLAGAGAMAQSAGEDERCRACPPWVLFTPADSVMDVYFSDGTVLRNCLSAERVTLETFSGHVQAIRLAFARGSDCADTVVTPGAIREIHTGSLGGSGAPKTVKVRPVPSFYKEKTEELPTGLLEAAALAGYAGGDESTREVGFEPVFFGLEGLLGGKVGDLAGNDITLAGGLALILEGGRLRIPVLAHARMTLSGSPHVVDLAEYYPDRCLYYGETASTAHVTEQGYANEPAGGDLDSSAYLLRSRAVEQSGFRPFLFLEAGYVFDTDFDGAHRRPSVNPDDYVQPLLLGAGAGLPLWDWGTLSLGYRFMQLNLRTECPECEGRFVVNNNEIHSLLLKFGKSF